MNETQTAAPAANTNTATAKKPQALNVGGVFSDFELRTDKNGKPYGVGKFFCKIGKNATGPRMWTAMIGGYVLDNLKAKLAAGGEMRLYLRVDNSGQKPVEGATDGRKTGPISLRIVGEGKPLLTDAEKAERAAARAAMKQAA
jgi:hypothetical protein